MGAAIRLGATSRHAGESRSRCGSLSRANRGGGCHRLKSPRGWLAAFDALVLAVGVIVFGVATGAFTGSVKGYDGWGHLTKVVLVLRDFPAVDWNYDWYSGSPFFLGGCRIMNKKTTNALDG